MPVVFTGAKVLINRCEKKLFSHANVIFVLNTTG